METPAGSARGAATFQPGDLWGGLAAAAVLLPQSMAFGVALFAMGNLDAATGAYAGLLGAAAVCLLSGLPGGTTGLVSAPTGPTLVLLGGAVTAMDTDGATGPGLLLGLAATIVIAGVLQALIGIGGGGRLIKYIPFPVVSGFMTGSAILMILSQRAPLSGGEPGAAWAAWVWLPALAALATIGGARLAEAKLPQLPGPVAGLLVGTAVFHAVAGLNAAALPSAWMIGTVPGPRAPEFVLSAGALASLPFAIILPAAAALAVLASLDTLLTAVVADVATGRRHRSAIELCGQGLGQVVAGALGAMAGAGTTGATVVAIKSGGRRWTAVATAAVLLGVIAAAGDVGNFLPIGALAGVIVYVAIDLADRDILFWARQGRTRQDAGIAVLVTLVTVFYDLMIAVALGVAIAAMLFIREQIRAPVVHRRSTGSQMRSVRKRATVERSALDANGDRIVVFELRGNLFFGTADRLVDELGADLDGPAWIILHLRKVTRIDLTALKLLRQIAERLHQHGGTLLLCELHRGAGIGSDVAAALETAGNQPLTAPVLTFKGRDEALAFAEDALLDALDCDRTGFSDYVPVAANSIAAYVKEHDLATLEAALESRQLERGETLFRAGEAGNDVFLVMRGELDVRIQTGEHHDKRLATYGPGTFLGELALLKQGPRAAGASAALPTDLRILSRRAFDDIRAQHPQIAVALLSAICDVLVTNQRWSTREMQRLSEW